MAEAGGESHVSVLAALDLTDAELYRSGFPHALFTFLNAGKQSVVGAATDPHVAALVAEAALVIEAHGLESDAGQRRRPRPDVGRLRAASPSLVVLSITPYALTGPWAGRAVPARPLCEHRPLAANARTDDRSGQRTGIARTPRSLGA